jgi:long-chain acyl-CoA synthetase
MINEEGFLFVEDRLKDMILRGGANVYCAEVEAALYEHPAVYEAAVCGVPDERMGESVAAVVVLREDAYLTEDQLRAFLSTRLAPYKIPSRVAFTFERLPTSGTGKIAKSTLVQRYFRTAD